MAGTASVAGEVFVDALPYFDQGYDAAGVREAVSIRSFVPNRSVLAEHANISMEWSVLMWHLAVEMGHFCI